MPDLERVKIRRLLACGAILMGGAMLPTSITGMAVGDAIADITTGAAGEIFGSDVGNLLDNLADRLGQSTEGVTANW